MSVSDTKVRKIIDTATSEARRSTPRPRLLTWCIRSALYERYGWRPYY
jgi:hypothetical protein